MHTSAILAISAARQYANSPLEHYMPPPLLLQLHIYDTHLKSGCAKRAFDALSHRSRRSSTKVTCDVRPRVTAFFWYCTYTPGLRHPHPLHESETAEKFATCDHRCFRLFLHTTLEWVALSDLLTPLIPAVIS